MVLGGDAAARVHYEKHIQVRAGGLDGAAGNTGPAGGEEQEQHEAAAEEPAAEPRIPGQGVLLPGTEEDPAEAQNDGGGQRAHGPPGQDGVQCHRRGLHDAPARTSPASSATASGTSARSDTTARGAPRNAAAWVASIPVTIPGTASGLSRA